MTDLKKTKKGRRCLVPMDGEAFIDLADLAKYLKVKKQTTYHFVTTLKIPHYRVGRLLRFKPSEVDAWMVAKKLEEINVPHRKLERI